MQVTSKTRRQLQLQNMVFLAALLAVAGLLAWLSTQYSYQADWTSGGRNTLSVDSRKLLDELTDPVRVTAFARENPALRNHIRDLLARYQRHKPDITLDFVNPDSDPERVRELGITLDGELLVSYQGRSEKVQETTEQALTNSLLRIARQEQRKVAFISGHGERNPHGEANHDFGNFGQLLEKKGIQLENLNLTRTPSIAGDINLLVIAAPQVDPLPGEVQLLNRYLQDGGNLLWLVEPGELSTLAPLAEALGMEILPGVVVDATTRLFGIDDPAFALITDYPMHPVTRDMASLTLFPQAAALEVEPADGWEGQALLTTLDRAWTEIGPISGTIRFDQDSDERFGPLDIGWVFTRSRPGSEDDNLQQRVIVIGDADFLANSYLGNGANVDLGLKIFNWLNNDDSLVTITARTSDDTRLELGQLAQAMIGFGFLFVLPALLAGTGAAIWWRRRRR